MKYFYILIFLIFTTQSAFSQVSVVSAFPNLTFSRPIDLQYAPDGTNRLFIVEQSGNIYVIENDSTTSQKKLFFSLKDSVDTGNEQGLLGLTFHPNYKNNGYFYVSYNPAGPDSSIIARYEVSADPDVADQGRKKIILGVKQPATNHNGGQIAFGPDGYLYIGFGDGGGSNNQYKNAQNLHTLLGAMLRINVDDTSSYGNYAIPEDNPFVGNDSSYREEIYAYGLRNPWRWSFDPVTGWLWCGDVGQDNWEEVDIIRKGGNYGWNIMEGTHCNPSGSECDDSGLIYPIVDYKNPDLGVAVTGGHVYRGSKVPDLFGKYVYGDYRSGLVWTCVYDGINEPVNELLLSSGKTISAFGVDKDYELYLCDLGGKIYKFYQPYVALNLDAPVLLLPENNADSVRTDTVFFNWHTVGNAQKYLLEIASENTFAAEYFSTTTVDTFANVPLNASSGVDFFWHVKAISGTDTSGWSVPLHFTTRPNVTHLKQKDNTPHSFQLMQNYPNPFNPETIINYQLPMSNKVTLKVFDITGKEIQTLVNKYQVQGTYSVTFDATHISSGIYFYKLMSSSGFSQTRKMVLLK